MKIEKNENPKFYGHFILNISNNEIFYLAYKESNIRYSSGFIKNQFNTIFVNQKILRSHIKRALDDKTLVEATRKWDYTHWLTQEDIADIARLEYNCFCGIDGSSAEFEVLGSLTQLSSILKLFQSKINTEKLTTSRLTLIINLDQLHWVTLVVSYQENNYVSYYADSKNNPIPSSYFRLMFDQLGIQPFSLSPGFTQQQDGYNCGLWALENAADLNYMLDYSQPINWLITALKRPRNKEYFDGKRIALSEKLSADPVWRERHSSLLQNLNTQKKSSLLFRNIFSTLRTEPELPDAKRFKIAIS